MERGLLWLPLLGIFCWLAWSGWNEYRKIEAYRVWAEAYEKTKYDIYSVVGQKDRDLTWGQPTRSGPVNLQTFCLDEIEAVNLLINQELANLDNLDLNGSVAIEFKFLEDRNSICIPFTQVSLAAEWVKYLRQEVSKYR